MNMFCSAEGFRKARENVQIWYLWGSPITIFFKHSMMRQYGISMPLLGNKISYIALLMW